MDTVSIADGNSPDLVPLVEQLQPDEFPTPGNCAGNSHLVLINAEWLLCEDIAVLVVLRLDTVQHGPQVNVATVDLPVAITITKELHHVRVIDLNPAVWFVSLEMA